MRYSNKIYTFTWYITLSLLTSCGGSGGSSENVAAPPGDTAAPVVEILFPPAGALVDDSEVFLRGKASDTSGISEILVNGVSAISEDDFATWSVRVPLGRGTHVLNVQATDNEGNTDLQAAQIQLVNELLSVLPQTSVVDIDRNQALVLYTGIPALVSVDLETGEREILFGDRIQDDVQPLVSPQTLALDPANNQVLVLDSGARALFAIDLDTGQRRVVTNDESLFSGRYFSSMVLDPLHKRVLIGYQNFNPFGSNASQHGGVMAIDLSTGRTSFLVDAASSATQRLYRPGALALDAAFNRLLITEGNLDGSYTDALLAADLNSGDLEVLFTGDGMDVDQPSIFSGLAVNESERMVIILDAGNQQLLFFNLISQEWTKLDVSIDSSSSALQVTIGLNPNRIALDGLNNRILVMETGNHAIDAIDLVSGERTVLSQISRVPNAEDPVISPRAIVYDASNNRALIADPTLNAIVSVDARTGERRIVHAGDEGSRVAGFRAITIDERFYRLLFFKQSGSLLDIATHLVALDLASGEETIISTSGTDGSGDWFRQPTDLVIDSDARLAYLRDINEITRIDLTTGDLSVFFSIVRSDPPPFPIVALPVAGMAIDPANNRLLLLNEKGGIMAVDLESGQESLVVAESESSSSYILSWNTLLMSDEDETKLLLQHSAGVDMIDLESGGRQILAASDLPNTRTRIFLWFHATLDTTRSQLLLVERILGAIFVVDLQSGEWAILSR